MTDKEKAERYDSLQMAIRFARDNYIDRAEESRKKSREYEVRAGAFSLYERGASVAYECIAKDLEKWIDGEQKNDLI